MADIKKLFADASVENATLQAEVESLITIAESKTTGIPQSRFSEKVRECNELRADKTELESKITQSDTTIEQQNAEIDRLKVIETEFSGYKDIEHKGQLDKWNERKKVLLIDDADPEFDKVQKVIHKFNMEDEITAEQVKANNNLFETYEEVDYFAVTDNGYKDGKKPSGAKLSKTNPFDLKNGINGAFRDMTEAFRISKEDPAKAKQLRESAGSFKE